MPPFLSWVYIYKMVKFLEYDETEDISADLDNDLKIINEDLPPKGEDLKTSPFIQQPARIKNPAFKPQPPKQEDIEADLSVKQEIELDKLNEPQTLKVKSIKPKKPLTEKQLANLEKMRMKKIEKAQQKVEKTMAKNDITKDIEKPKEYSQEEVMDMEQAEFENWMKYMDKFDKMMKAIQKDKERQAMEVARKEKEIEDRIRKKIEMENQQRNNVSAKTQEANVPILQQPTLDFGTYSQMFGY